MRIACRSCRVTLRAVAGAALAVALFSPCALGSVAIRPGATITLEFPDFGPMFHDRNLTGRVEVYVPTDWAAERTLPLLCWFGGGYGTHKADVPRKITDGRGYVCVSLPYRPAEEGTGVGWRQQDGGWGTSWRHYVPILAEVARVVPNIDPERRVVMGMSSGGAAIGCMIDETEDFTDYFYAFGVAGYAWWHGRGDRLKGRPVLLYGGVNDSRMDSREKDLTRYGGCGADAEVIVYEGKGHTLAPEYFPQMRDWLERKVARRGLPEAMASMKSALAARRWTTALQFVQRVLHRARENTQEYTAARETFTTISEEGDREIAELLAGSPKAAAVREFAAAWAPCLCASKAREAADRLAEAKLKSIVATTVRNRASKLGTFLADWEGYPVHEKALAAYEEDAAKALAMLEKQFVSARKLRDFVDKWSPAPSAQRALEKLEALAEKELARIMNMRSGSSRKSRLRSFARDYKGTRSASKAQETLQAAREQEAGEILARVKTRSTREQKRLLAAFLKSYPGTEAAKEAQRLLDDLAGRRR